MVIHKLPWDFLSKPLFILWISYCYLYWAIPIVYFRTSLPKYNCISVAVKIHTSFTTNQRVWYFNLYDPNSSDPILTLIFCEVVPLIKRHGIPVPPTESITVSLAFYFPLSFSLAVKCRVFPGFHLFLIFFIFIITPIITFSEMFLELCYSANIFLPLFS